MMWSKGVDKGGAGELLSPPILAAKIKNLLLHAHAIFLCNGFGFRSSPPQLKKVVYTHVEIVIVDIALLIKHFDIIA